MIVDLFTLYLREKKYKYSIHNINGFIHLLPVREEYKYLIYNDNRFIYPLFERESVQIFNS